MSKNTHKTVDNEQRTDTIVGIITVLAVLALIVWFFVSVSVRGNAISEIAYENETRRGQEQVFTANVKSSKIKDGANVKWIVDVRQGRTAYLNLCAQNKRTKLCYGTGRQIQPFGVRRSAAARTYGNRAKYHGHLRRTAARLRLRMLGLCRR